MNYRRLRAWCQPCYVERLLLLGRPFVAHQSGALIDRRCCCFARVVAAAVAARAVVGSGAVAVGGACWLARRAVG